MSAFVYILHCADSSYYVGSARGDYLDKRLSEQEAGTFGGYTSLRRPVRLVYHEHFDQITDAIAAERRIKGWNRAKKEALIREDWPSVQWLAKRPGGRARAGPRACFEARPDGLAPQHEEIVGADKAHSPHPEARAKRTSKDAPVPASVLRGSATGLAPQHEEIGGAGQTDSPHPEARAKRASKDAPAKGSLPG